MAICSMLTAMQLGDNCLSKTDFRSEAAKPKAPKTNNDQQPFAELAARDFSALTCATLLRNYWHFARS